MAVDPTIIAAQSMPLPPQNIQDAFLAQGIIGAVALIALAVAGYIYREREKDRKEWAAALAAQAERHEKIIAAKDAANQKLQEDRIVEMRTATTELAKALQTVDHVTDGFESAVDALSKARSAA